MNDLNAQIRRAAERIRPDWTPEAAARIWSGVQRRGQRRRATRIVSASAAVCAIAIGLAGFLRVERPADGRGVVIASAPAPIGLGARSTTHAEPAAPPVDETLRFQDGSSANVFSGGQLRALIDEPGRVSLELAKGRARFEVVPNPQRPFVVTVGGTRVTVKGTVFTVHREDQRVAVAVEVGHVVVDSSVGRHSLISGEARWFPIGDGSRSKRRQATTGTGKPRSSSVAASAGPSIASSLAAADEARLAGRPGEAVNILSAALKRRPADGQAAVAAFTLGRVLMLDLGRYEKAARVFAQAGALAPEGTLAEDAWAREVEAWARAGAATHARARAQAYLRAYPAGRRVAEVRRFGGLD